MKNTTNKAVKITLYLFLICCFAAIACFCIAMPVSHAEGSQSRTDAYRNRLAYSAARGWNNDPNGLLYVDGTYHMYYQYNWDGSNTENVWGHMSWGHAVSSDLVHWEERTEADGVTPLVAIPENIYDKDGNHYAMMFSGSAVYDEHNTSGLFDVDGEGNLLDGQGIVAILTQPRWNEARKTDMQRQILAYSKDDGDHFEIYGEIIAGPDNGNGGYEEFRDPKVFWSESHGKWLMAVGGGSVRMYSSENLRDWDLIGETGLWGECPDISRFTVGDVEKYVLIISPEDKDQSHSYNGTTRKDTFYPAEYYAVGELDADGLFVPDGGIKRLSEGLDSYAFQSFNSAPDGKVYGVSWSACWKNVGEYNDFGRDFNGGLTVVCEMGLVERDGEYILTRKPVEGFAALRGNALAEFDGVLETGENALDGAHADVADITAEIDFTDSDATLVEMALRVSEFERISLAYDRETEELTLDRGESSLLAKDTFRYNDVFKKRVPLADGNKLSLRILLDRAFVSVFANDGEASFFASVFPTAYSDGMSLTADVDIAVKVAAYAMSDIYGGMQTRNELFVTTDEINTVVGRTNTVAAYSFGSGFDPADVAFAATRGAENISISAENGVAKITALKSGASVVTVNCNGETREIALNICEDAFVSDVDYTHKLGGSAKAADDGLRFSGDGDAFVFSDTSTADFIYSAAIDILGSGQAAGMVFGANDTYSHYYVVTVDVKDNKLKLWEAGVGDLTSVDRVFEDGVIRLTVIAVGGEVSVFVDEETTAALTCDIDDTSGFVGLNVYKSETAFNSVRLTTVKTGAYSFDFGGINIYEIRDGDDGRLLTIDDYTRVENRFTLSDAYVKTLAQGAENEIEVYTDNGVFVLTVNVGGTEMSLSVANDVYYEKADIVLTLSREADVTKILVDGKPVSFTSADGVITLSSDLFDKLGYGLHGVRVYTNEGRAFASFTFGKKEEPAPPEPEAPVDYTFLIIDLCIFGGIILAYLIGAAVVKRKNRK